MKIRIGARGSALSLDVRAIVENRPGATTDGGVVDLNVFLAPGLFAAQAMQTATTESSWPLFAGFLGVEYSRGQMAGGRRSDCRQLGRRRSD